MKANRVTTASRAAPFAVTEDLIGEYYKAVLENTKHNSLLLPSYYDYFAAQKLNSHEKIVLSAKDKEALTLHKKLDGDKKKEEKSEDIFNSSSHVLRHRSKNPVGIVDHASHDRFLKLGKIGETETVNHNEDNTKHSRELSSDSYTVFFNKETLKQLLNMIPGGNTFLATLHDWKKKWEQKKHIKYLLRHRYDVTSYDAWVEIGNELDELTNKLHWKEVEESKFYDYALLKKLTLEMRKLREEGQHMELLYLMRTRWVRNLGNMGNVNLYRMSHYGTKNIIDDYMNESTMAIDSLLNDSDLDDGYLLSVLQQTRRNIGRTALVLSGGGTFGLFHIGVLAALFEQDLLPKVISGSSAGAIVASIFCVHQTSEIPQLLKDVLDMEFNIFKDDADKSDSEDILLKVSRFFQDGTWFDSKHLVKTMQKFLGDLTFREAYNRSGRILNVTVSPMSVFEQPRLLNHLTSPHVLIWSAVCASCAVPGIFPSTPLYEKNPDNGEQREWEGSIFVKFVDGSVDNDLPITRLSEMFNVDHIIAAQVNIHVFPFLKMSVSCVGGDVQNEFTARLRKHATQIGDFFAEEVIHLLEMGCELEISKNILTKLRSMLSQQYSGDVTILPDMKMIFQSDKLLLNPTRYFLLFLSTYGARATWPKIHIIKNHCNQENALDKAISYLKEKMIMASSIKNPLRIPENPVGLLKPILVKTHSTSDEENESPPVLDDNIMETDDHNLLMLLPEFFNERQTALMDFIESVEELKLGQSNVRRRRASDITAYGAPEEIMKEYTYPQRPQNSRKFTTPSRFILRNKTKSTEQFLNAKHTPYLHETKEHSSPLVYLSTAPSMCLSHSSEGTSYSNLEDSAKPVFDEKRRRSRTVHVSSPSVIGDALPNRIGLNKRMSALYTDDLPERFIDKSESPLGTSQNTIIEEPSKELDVEETKKNLNLPMRIPRTLDVSPDPSSSTDVNVLSTSPLEMMYIP